MSRVCEVTGKRPIAGNNVSHANNKTRRRFLPNLHTHRFWVPSEKRFVKLRVSKKGLRIIDKKGIEAVLAEIAPAALITVGGDGTLLRAATGPLRRIVHRGRRGLIVADAAANHGGVKAGAQHLRDDGGGHSHCTGSCAVSGLFNPLDE